MENLASMNNKQADIVSKNILADAWSDSRSVWSILQFFSSLCGKLFRKSKKTSLKYHEISFLWSTMFAYIRTILVVEIVRTVAWKLIHFFFHLESNIDDSHARSARLLSMMNAWSEYRPEVLRLFAYLFLEHAIILYDVNSVVMETREHGHRICYKLTTAVIAGPEN